MFSFRKRKKAEPKHSADAGAVVADSVDALLAAAVAKGLVPEDRDLGVIPEIMPIFQRASLAFHGIVIEAMERAAANRDPRSGLAVMQRSCMYLFGKGVQAVMLWAASSDGKIDIDFEPGSMARMEMDPNFELDPDDNQKAADAMVNGLPLFVAHQAFMSQAIANMGAPDENFVREEMLKTLQWVPRIAISFALMKGYGRG